MTFPESVRIALDRLYSAGYEAYLVGGCVRDWVMGRVPSDYDITTPSTPDETKAVFEGFPVFLQGEKHGTVGVIIEGEKLEITTHRRDGDYTDHRRPESVTFSRTLADDLSRRDFTVNAMAYSPHSGIVDLFDGREDVERKIIRCVGDPSRRFDEDALRILRAIRFSSTLGFEIEDKTEKAIFENAQLLKTVSAERIREELEKLVMGVNAACVTLKYETVLNTVLQRFDAKTFCTLLPVGNTLKSRMASLFCASSEECISFLKLSNENALFYKRVRRMFFEELDLSEYGMKRLAYKNGEEALLCALFLKGCTEEALILEKLISDGVCMHKRDMMINGDDLISLGFEQGTKMGQVLDSLFELVLKGELANERKVLLEYVKTKI